MTARKTKSGLAIKVYIFLASAFIVLFLLDAFVLPWFIHSRTEIAIPNVIGKKVSDAQNILVSRGLNPIVAGKAPSNKYPPGHVVFIDPVALSVVREGRNVYLTVSGGEEQVQVPNLRGRSFRDAKITIEQLDLRLGLVTYEPSDLPVETVIAQGATPGKRVAKSSAIEIVLSSGPEMIQIDVPYLIGMSLSEAQRTLVEQGLRLGNITYRQSSNLLPNTVISQSPNAGEKADINSAVDITIVH